MTRPTPGPHLVLFMGVGVASCAAILIRWAQAPALAIAAYRLVFASAILLPLAGWRASGAFRAGAMRRRELALAILSGFFLACHFALWISSLTYTTVASSVVLVSTNPLWMGLLSPLLGERVNRWMAVGIGISVLGGALIGMGDLSLGATALWGDALALGGAWMVLAYFLLGRSLQRRLGLLVYVTPVYTAAAVFLVLFALAAGVPLSGYSPQTLLMCLLLALGPQLIGHSSLNWSLRHLSPAFVTVATLGEPVGSAALSFVLLGEIPPLATLAGGALILVGIYFSLQGERARLRLGPEKSRHEADAEESTHG